MADLNEKRSLRRELFEMQWRSMTFKLVEPEIHQPIQLTSVEKKKLAKLHVKHGGIPLNDAVLFRNIVAQSLGLFVTLPDAEVKALIKEHTRPMGPFVRPLMDLDALYKAAEEMKAMALADRDMRSLVDDAQAERITRDGTVAAAAAALLNHEAPTMLSTTFNIDDYAAPDPWEETAKRLFADVGGDPLDVRSTVPIFAVRRFVNCMLKDQESSQAIEAMFSRLERVYQRLHLPEFTQEVVKPLRAMCVGTLGGPQLTGASVRRSRRRSSSVSPRRMARPTDLSVLFTPTIPSNTKRERTNEDVIKSLAVVDERDEDREKLYRSAMHDTRRFFEAKCLLSEGEAPLLHLADLHEERLLAFVSRSMGRHVLLMRKTKRVVQRFLNGLTAAAKVVHDHHLHCKHCHLVDQVLSSPPRVTPRPPPRIDDSEARERHMKAEDERSQRRMDRAAAAVKKVDRLYKKDVKASRAESDARRPRRPQSSRTSTGGRRTPSSNKKDAPLFVSNESLLVKSIWKRLQPPPPLPDERR